VRAGATRSAVGWGEPWTAQQLGAFLGWAKEHSGLHAAWYVLAYTGMRRGELLALRWRDIDPSAATIAVRRSVGVVRNAGEGAEIKEGPPKTKKSRRVIDIDPGTVAVLRAWKKQRGALALALARDDALVFSDLEGRHLHPERFSRTFREHLARCRKALGDSAPPEIRCHDLRHTHATLLQMGRVASDASFRRIRECVWPAVLFMSG
jgi:integrase